MLARAKSMQRMNCQLSRQLFEQTNSIQRWPIDLTPSVCMARYQNVKQELEQQQNLERIRAEKFFKRMFKSK